jgi:hypothetical protein
VHYRSRTSRQQSTRTTSSNGRRRANPAKSPFLHSEPPLQPVSRDTAFCTNKSCRSTSWECGVVFLGPNNFVPQSRLASGTYMKLSQENCLETPSNNFLLGAAISCISICRFRHQLIPTPIPTSRYRCSQSPPPRHPAASVLSSRDPSSMLPVMRYRDFLLGH